MALFRRKAPSPQVEPERPTLPVTAPAPGSDGLRSADDHRAFVLDLIEPLIPFGMSLLDAVGLSLTESIRADGDIPAMAAVPDLRNGDLLLAKGTALAPRHIGFLAGAGIDKVLATPRPRVVVIPVGGGFADPGRRVDARPFDASSYLVAAGAKAAGAQVWRVRPGTEEGALRETISDQLIRADLIITVGGLDDDHLADVVGTLGAIDVTDTALRPGTRQGVGLIGDDLIPVLMIPDDMLGAQVSFEAFIRPAIDRLMGLDTTTAPVPRPVSATVTVEDTVVRARLTGAGTLDLHPEDASHLSAVRDDAVIAFVPQPTLAAGDPVAAWVLDG